MTTTVKLACVQTLLVSLLSLAVRLVQAEPLDPTSFRIINFHSDIVINEDLKLSVKESISISRRDLQISTFTRRLISRYRDMEMNPYVLHHTVKGVSINGKKAQYSVKDEGGPIDITIQLPPDLATTEQVIEIDYSTGGYRNWYSEFSQFLWVVNDYESNFTHEHISATVSLPSIVPTAKIKAYGFTGNFGGTSNSLGSQILDNKVSFATTAVLGPREGLTIVVEWPRGYLVEPETQPTPDAIHPGLAKFENDDSEDKSGLVFDYISTLSDESIAIEKRVKAAWSLAELRQQASPAIDTLLKTLNSDEEKLRNASGLALSRIGETSVQPVVNALQENNAKYPTYALLVLSSIGPKASNAFEILKRYAENGTKEEKLMAIRGLGSLRLKAKAAIPLLISALTDRELNLNAVLALGDIDAKESVDALILLLDKKYSDEIRTATAESLRAIGPVPALNAAIPALIEILKAKDHWSVSTSARLLGVMKAQDAVPALIETLNHESIYAQTAAAGALNKIGTPEAKNGLTPFMTITLPKLINQLRSKDYKEQCSVAAAISYLGDQAESAIPVLREGLHNSYFGVRGGAAVALGEIGAKSVVAVPELIEILKENKDVYVSVLTAGALAKIGTPEALSALKAYGEAIVWELEDSLTSPQEDLKASSVGALKAIGTAAALEALEGYE